MPSHLHLVRNLSVAAPFTLESKKLIEFKC